MATLVPKAQYKTVEEFAIQEGMAVTSIYKALHSGRLGGHKIGKTWLIPSTALISKRRIRDGRTAGITELKNNDLDGFLKKRGIINR